MTRSLLKSALKLGTAERLLLVQRLWDSIADKDVPRILIRAQGAELNGRLRRLDKTGPRGSTWGAVKSRITNRAPRA